MTHAFQSRARLAALGVAAAALALFVDVRGARACSLPLCQAPVRLGGMEFVPGNLVYFEITAENPPAMALRTEAGEPIPASIRTIGGDRVFAPDAPIPPETNVVLEYTESCYYEGTEPPRRGEFAFRTFEHLPVTLQPGHLFVQEYGVASPGQLNNEHAFVRIKLQPMADYAAEHLMKHELSIDGQRSSPWALLGSAWQVSVNSFCTQQYPEIITDSCGAIWHVPEGRHTLTLTSHILGHDVPLEPLTLEIETRCPTSEAEVASDSTDEPPTVGDRAMDDPSPGDATGEVADAPPTDGNGEAPGEVRDGASCALPGGRAASSHAGTVLFLLGALGLARSVRRPRHSRVD